MDSDELITRLRRKAGRLRRQATGRRNAVQRAVSAESDPMHLVASPVFVMCSVRSGSTLLRSILDTHRDICAPHELHFNTLRVTTKYGYARRSWRELGLKPQDLENLAWDRALHYLLVTSGKRIIVDKTPQNGAIWRRIHEYWPQARYIFLRRHPASMYDSLVRARPDLPNEVNEKKVLAYCERMDDARPHLPGPTIRYEDLTAEPERIARQLCDYLGVPWEPRMLNYNPGPAKPGLGDWSDNIKSGKIQPARDLPKLDEITPGLREQAIAWGYS